MVTNSKFAHLEKVQDSLELCTKCGYCTFWCPVYQENPEEVSAARGKLTMTMELLAGKQDLSDAVREQISRCMLCGTCLEHCSEKVPTPSIMLALRADQIKINGVKFPYNIIYRWLMPHRTFFGRVVRFGSWFQGFFMPKTEGNIRHLAFFLEALGKGRHIPSIAGKFLRQMVPTVNKPPAHTKPRLKAGYFMGCMTDFVFPRVGKHIIEFLNKNGVEVVVPKGQGCCGAPVYLGAGDFETGRKLADANIRALKDVDYVVCSCATCASAMKHYVQFLADTPARKEAYAQMAAKVKDITEFLVDVLELPSSAYRAAPEVEGKKITWHDPCHLNRYLGITEQPRQIIKSIPGVEFREMIRPDWCCGMAGAFSIDHYDLSQKIAARKIDAIKTGGADILVTDCPGCQIQLADHVLRHKLPVKVMHILELLQ